MRIIYCSFYFPILNMKYVHTTIPHILSYIQSHSHFIALLRIHQSSIYSVSGDVNALRSVPLLQHCSAVSAHLLESGQDRTLSDRRTEHSTGTAVTDRPLSMISYTNQQCTLQSCLAAINAD